MVVRWLGLGFYSCIAMLRLLRLHGEHVHCHLSISLSLYTSLSLSSPPPCARIPDVDGELVFLETRLGPSS